MKNRVFILSFLISMISVNFVFAQTSTKKLSYQAVVRNAANELVVNQNLAVEITILDAGNAPQYRETHPSVPTNQNGLLWLWVGEGTPTLGTMADVVWKDAVIRSVFTLPDGSTVTQNTPVTAMPHTFFADEVDTVFLQNYLDTHDVVPDNYVTHEQLNDTLGHYFDSTQVKTAIHDTANAIRAAIPASQVNADWNATGGPAEILNKPDLSVYATNAHLNDTLNSFATKDMLSAYATKDTLANFATTNALKDSLSRYVGKDKLNDTLDSYYTKNNIDNKLNDYEKKSELCGDVKDCIKDTLGKYTTSDNIDTLLGAYFDSTQVKSAIHDTANAIRAAIPASQVNADWNATGGPAEILNKPDLSVYATNAHLNDTLNSFATKDTLSAYATKDTLANFATTNALKDSLSQYVGKSKLNDTLDSYYTKNNVDNILNDYEKKSELCGDVKECIKDTLGKYTTSSQIDTLLGAYFDSTQVKTAIHDTANAIRAAIPASQVNADWNATGGPAEILNKPDLSVYATTNALKDSLSRYVGKDKLNDTLDSYYTKNTIDNRLNDYEKKSELCGDVKECIKDTLGKYTTTNQIDTLLGAYYDSAQVKSAIHDTANAIRAAIPASQVNADWNATGGPAEILNKPDLSVYATTNALKDSLTRYVDKDKLTDTLDSYYTKNNIDNKLNDYEKKSELCGDVKECIKDTLGKYTTSSQIDTLLGVYFDSTKVKTAIHDSLTQNVELTIKSDSLFLKSGGDIDTVKLPAVPEQVKSDWKETNTSSAAYILNKPVIKDSVNIVVKDSLRAANSAINKAIDTIALNVVKDTLKAYYDTTRVKALVHDSIGNGKITIKKNGATITDGAFYLNQKTDQTINITVPTQTSELTNNSNLAYTTGNTFSGTHDFTATTITVPSNEDAIKRPVPTTTPAPECTNMNAVNVCDLLAVFDSLTNKMNDILKTIDTLKKVNDSLAKEIESLKPSLTVTGPSDEQYLCGGSNTITFTASVTNANAGDYTYSWTVNGTAQSSTDATLYYTPKATGEYKVMCTATRSGFTPLKDSTTVNVSGGGYMPKFGICIEGRTVTVKSTENLLTTTVVWGDGAESVVTAGDSHEYANGNYTIIASSTAFGNCKLSWPITITETTPNPCTVTTPHTNTSIYTNTTGGLETVVDGKVVSVLDQEGNMYYVTQIGNQCWMRTNLRTSKYNDGSTIPGGENCTNYSITDPYHYINSSYDPSYGYFYNWSAASHKNNGNRLNLCPKGWHVPSQEEWAMLFSEAGVTTPKETGTGAVYLAGGCNWEGTTFGASSVTPNSYENQNRDKWGFTALPAGRAWVDNTNGLNLEFEEYGRGVYFWSSTEVDAQHAYDWYLGAGYPGAANESLDKVHGRLVRCLRDENDSPVTPTTSCTVTSVGTNEVGEGTEITAVKDYNDENSYSVMQIGSQCWMAENMRSTKYTDGTPVSAGIYAPNGNLGNVPEYGYLYNFAAAMHNSATSGAQGICPIGWHMPSKAELEIMLANGSFGTAAKAGLFAGLYAFFSEEADFWSTTQGSFSSYKCLRYGDNIFFEVEPENAVSVRCVRDGGPVIEPSLSLVASPDANSVTICSSTSTPAISEAYVVTYTATIENDNASEYTFKWTLDGNLYDGDNAGENAITLYWVSQGDHTVKCTATKGSTVLERTADLTVTLGIVPEFNIHHTTGLTVRLEIDPGYDVASIDWGDNSSEDVPANTGQVYHEYGAEGTYKVIVYSSVLCSDSAQVTVATTPTFACGTSTVNDYDDNEYNTVLIGSHCWMAENLRSTHYSDGTSITTCNSGTDGVTYKWAAAMNNSLTEGAQGACPEGWHVPTKDECQTMINNGSLPIAEFWTSTSSDEYEAYNCWVNGASGGFNAFDKQNACSSVRCVRDAESGGETSQNPSVATGDPTNVTSTSATLNATITPAGNETIMTRGFQLKVSGGDYDTLMFSGTDDVYSVTVDTLSAGVTYVYRAFISYGSSYTPAFGEEVEFTTLSPSPTTFVCGTSTVSDYDGNEYNTVLIGSQCWMKSNLRTTKYADGTSITNPGDTSIVSETTPYFYDYDYYWYNSQDYVPVPLEERGYYYNWVAVMKGSEMSNTNPSNVQGICPTDWHVPSRAEWVQLNNYLSSNSEYWCGDDPENVAKALSAATGRWGGGSGCHVGDLTGNNSTQFTAFPTYSDLNLGGHCARFWTSMQNEGGDACYYLLAQNKSTLMRSYANIGSAYSVRCVKNVTGSAAQTPPSVTTGGPSGVSQTEATLNASLTNNDDVIITGRGFKYKASDEETYHDIYTSVGITESFTDFSISLDGLLPSTEYSYYAYVTYQGYTAVGTERTFVTASPATGFQCGTSEVQDVDGNHYHTVVIGSQCWLKENLRTVGSITNYKKDENFSKEAYYTTVPYYFQPTTTEFEDFDLDYDSVTYGLYYNRIAALGGYEGNSSGDPVNPIQGVCPSGWHIPSKSEWEVLVSVINDEAGRLAGGTDWEDFDCLNEYPSWAAPNNECFSSRDCYGFSALPAGWFDIAYEMIDDLYPPKEMACFWSSTVIPDQQYPETYVFQLFYDEDEVTLDKDYYDSYACPVRCVRDSE